MFFIDCNPLKTLESKTNPIIKRAQRAVAKCNNDLLLVEGHKLLDEALKSGARPEMIFVEHPHDLREKQNLSNICYLVPRAILRDLSTVQNPAEILAFLNLPSAPTLSEVVAKASMLVILDRLQDPGNLGTIMRTAEAMGVNALILLKGCCSQFNHKVIRAAMGSSFRLPVVADVAAKELFNLLQQHGYATICADMDGEPLPEFAFPARSAVFFGQEGQGLADEILKECKSRLAIPMQGQVESLNVATSTAICLYEWSRKKFID